MTEQKHAEIEWSDALKSIREPLPMEPEIWAAGADIETAEFVARQLRTEGYYLIRPSNIDWEDIRRFQSALKGGQSINEDAGGFFARCIRALFGITPEENDEVTSYRRAADELLAGMMKY